MVVFGRWKLLAKFAQVSALAGVATATAVAASVAAAAVFKTFLAVRNLSSKVFIDFTSLVLRPRTTATVDPVHVSAADKFLLVVRPLEERRSKLLRKKCESMTITPLRVHVSAADKFLLITRTLERAESS
jgi:hypothetical protein